MHKSPGNDEENEGIGGNAEQDLVVQRWSILWRSVCLATIPGRTLYPYHRFLRNLDLRDLENLLEEPKFSGKIERFVDYEDPPNRSPDLN